MADFSDDDREEDEYDEGEQEEMIDDEESAYVYQRGKKFDLVALVRPAASSVAKPTPRVTEVTGSSLPARFSAELDQFRSSDDVTITRVPNGAHVAVTGLHLPEKDYMLTVRLEVDEFQYPNKPAIWHLLPPKGLKIGEVQSILPALEGAILRLSGKPIVAEVVLVLRRWLNDAPFRKVLQDVEAQQRQAVEEEEARKVKAVEDLLELERLKNEAAKLPTWRPRSAVEEDQRTPPEGTTPCRVVTDLDLPRTGFLCAARVGSRVYFYGGMQEFGTYSDELHVLHIASRRVEVHKRPPRGQWPPVLVQSTAVAVGKLVLLFGGLTRVNKQHITPESGVWELNTVTLEWRRAGKMKPPRWGATATVLDNRCVLLFGGITNALTEDVHRTDYLATVEVFDTVTATFTEQKVTTASGLMPPGRQGHTAAMWQDKLVVFAGKGAQLYADVWVLDTKSWQWYGPLQKPEAAGMGRVHHSMCAVGGRLIIFGGEHTEGRALDDLLVYDLEERQFYSKPSAIPVDPRVGHVAIVTGGTMLVVGGATSMLRRRTTGLRTTDTVLEWTPVTSVAALAVAPAPIIVPPSKLAYELYDLRTQPSATSHTDLRVGPAGLEVHSFLLQARCPTLVGAISAAITEKLSLEIPKLTSPISYTAFINYVYTGNPVAQFIASGELPDVTREQLKECAVALSLEKLQQRLLSTPDVRYFAEVLEDIAASAGRPIRADFALVAGKHRLEVNKALLACRSEYFRAMLAAGMSETRKGELILAPQVSLLSAAALCKFLYTDELDASCAEHALELVPFADITQLSRLQRLAERLITDAFDMTDLDSVLALAGLAEESHSQGLLARCLFLVVQHFGLARATASAGWMMLSPEVHARARKLANE